jgi:hypothetical protein
MSFRHVLAAGAVALAAFAAPAGAMTVTIGQQYANVFGKPKTSSDPGNQWFLNQHVTHPGTSGPITKTYGAGMFRLTLDDHSGSGKINFNAFCVDLLERIDLPATYTVLPDLFGPTITSRISALISNVTLFDDANPTRPAMLASAIQLALWEIITDDELDLTKGAFQVITTRNQTNAVTTSRTTATGWLAQIVEGEKARAKGEQGGWQPGTRKFSYFVAQGTQDLTGIGIDIAVPIPLPAGLLLAATGVVGFAVLRRRPA